MNLRINSPRAGLLLAGGHCLALMTLTALLVVLPITSAIAGITVTDSIRPQVPPIVTPDPQRVAQIASWIGTDPIGPGRPIGDRAAWERAAARVPMDEVIAAAEKAMAEAPPAIPDNLYLIYSRTGSRVEYEVVFEQRRTRLSTLAWAEGFENHGRFIPAIVREAEAMLQEKSWVYPAHDFGLYNFNGQLQEIDLGVALRGWTLAMVEYWFGEKLPSEFRKKVRAELRRRVLDPYLATVRGGVRTNGFWWVTGSSNWNAVCHAGVVGIALIASDTTAEKAEIIAATEANIKFFFEGFSSDGYCSEGISYWGYGFGHSAILAEIVALATEGRMQLLDGELPRRITSYPANMEITPGVFPVFADGYLDSQPDAFIRALGERLLSGRKKGLPGRVVAAKELSDLVLYNSALQVFLPVENHEIQQESARPLRHWFTEAQVLVSRAGIDFGAAIKGGNNRENHNHNDKGSYVVAVEHATPLVDPGREVYTARTFGPDRYQSAVINSYGHSVPLIAGQLQSTDSECSAHVVSIECTEFLDRLVLDLRDAYKVQSLLQLNRTFELSRTVTPSVSVTDHVRYAKPEEFETALITFEEWREVSSGIIEIGPKGEGVRVEIFVLGGELKMRSETINEQLPGGRKPVRIGIGFRDPITEGSIRIRITPQNKSVRL